MEVTLESLLLAYTAYRNIMIATRPNLLVGVNCELVLTLKMSDQVKIIQREK